MMYSNIKIWLVLLLAMLQALNLAGQRLNAYVDSTQYLLGDHIHLKLRADIEDIESLKDITPLNIDSSGLELLEIKPWESKTENNNTYFSTEVLFIGFDSGAFFIPSIEVLIQKDGQIGDREATREIPIFVGSDSLQLQELVANKGLHYEGMIWQDYLIFIYVLIGALILGLGIRYWMKRGLEKPQEIENVPIIPANIWALESLDQLKSMELWQQGEVKQYYSKLSEILRGFLERKYEFYALEMTTNEILQNIRKQRKKEFPIEQTRDILQVSDMVKFAKYKPEESNHEPYWQKTNNLVQLIHEMDPPQNEEDGKKLGEEE